MSGDQGWYELVRRVSERGLTAEEEEVMRREEPARHALLETIVADARRYEAREEEHLAALRARLEEEGRAHPSAARRVMGWAWTWRRPALIGLAALAAAALAFWLMPPDRGEAPDTGFRGTLQVDVRAQHAGEVVEVHTGRRLAPGDRLRFVLTVGEPGWATVFSVDSTRRAWPFYPHSDAAEDTAPLRLDEAGRHELPGSIVLDDAVGLEYLITVYSPTEFDRARIHERAKDLLLDEGSAAVTADRLGIEGAIDVIVIEKLGEGERP